CIQNTMQKTLVLLSALFCAGIAQAGAPYFVLIKNDAGTQSTQFYEEYGARICQCVKNTQTGSITGQNGGDIKLFSSTDCTGNYETLGSNSVAKDTQWVNSLSFGASNIASSVDAGYCPNWYTL
ncbi:hypothetical protein BGZ79_008228, partial [Entomortierella chlamydospora]